LLEPALGLGADHPEVARFKLLGDKVIAHGLDTDPTLLREFLRVAGAPVDHGPLPDRVRDAAIRAHGTRSPWEARPSYEQFRRARTPILVASGGHTRAIELMCDAVAKELGAERIVVPGAGHFVANAPGFADRLDGFLRAIE
jgi:pimeloyl-ACP methyl ester carboxylesterase